MTPPTKSESHLPLTSRWIVPSGMRFPMMWLAVAAMTFLVLPASAGGAVGYRQPLFYIERSTNANVVMYDVNVDDHGRLAPKSTVMAYWIMKAEDGHREELTRLERRFAYGVDIVDRSATALALRLKAYSGRIFKVRARGQGYHAEVRIKGHLSVLERIFVQADNGGLMPSALYIDLHGRRLADGALVSERIRRD